VNFEISSAVRNVLNPMTSAVHCHAIVNELTRIGVLRNGIA